MLTYLLVQYREGDKPCDLMQFFGDLPEVVEWLEKQENAFQKWTIYEIARQVPYKYRLSVDVLPESTP